MTDEKKPKWDKEVHASIKAAIVFIDMMKHARALEEKSEAVQQRLMITLLEFLEDNLGNYDCIHYNFTGDGAMILFSTVESAAGFCLGFSALWQARIMQLKEDGELPSELNIPFRTGIHYGDVYPLGPRFKCNLQYTSSQIDCTSRLLKLDKELADAKAMIVATDIFVHEANKKTGVPKFTWRKLDIPFKPVECLLPDGYRLYELAAGEVDEKSKLEQIKPTDLHERPDTDPRIQKEFQTAFDFALNKEYDKALYHFHKVLMLDSDFVPAIIWVASILRSVGDLDGAISEYYEAIRLEPNNLLAHYNLGVALSDKGDINGAIAEFKKEMKRCPNNLWLRLDISVVLMRKHEYDIALAVLNEALCIDDGFYAIHYNLACAFSLANKFTDAISSLKRAIELDPQCKENALTDSDFDSIRHLPEFKALVGESDGGNAKDKKDE